MSEERDVPSSPPRVNVWKQLGSWLVIVASLAAIYWTIRGKAGTPTAAAVVLAPVGVFVAYCVIRFVLFMREQRRFLREQHELIAVLHRGELDAARDAYEKWSESRLARIAALSRHNLAWTLMRQGQLERAIKVAAHARERYANELIALSMWPTTTIDLALYHALRGELETAEKVMAELEPRRDVSSNSSFPAMRIVTRSVIACRRSDTQAAARILEEKWAECESLLTGDLVRPLRVLRAFAIATSDLRDKGKADVLLIDARPVYRGEYRFLGVEWPEMQAFLVTHGLA